MADLRWATVGVERHPPVEGIGADADSGVSLLPSGLNYSVEVLLHGTRSALQPVHVMVGRAEVLRGLDDAELGVGREVRDRLVQHVRARREVRIEY